MKQAHKVTRFPLRSDLRADSIDRFSNLVNQVYDEAELGIWKRKSARTDPTEVERFQRISLVSLSVSIEGCA